MKGRNPKAPAGPITPIRTALLTPPVEAVQEASTALAPRFEHHNIWAWRCPKWLQPIFDGVWPHVYKPTREEMDQEKDKVTSRRLEYMSLLEQFEDGQDEDIEAALESLEKVEETELERRRSIESRLTAVLGMTSISTALFGALISLQAKLGDSKSLDGLLWPAIGASTYGMTQLLLATRAAVNGLKRRGQIAMGIEDYLPAPGETQKERKIRTAKELVKKILDDEVTNCRRADRMEVAHVALRNFLVAMLLLAVFWPMGFLLSRKASPSLETGPAIREILSNPVLIERLRGPAGSMGPPGPPGQPPNAVPGPDGTRKCPSTQEIKKPGKRRGPVSGDQ